MGYMVPVCLVQKLVPGVHQWDITLRTLEKLLKVRRRPVFEPKNGVKRSDHSVFSCGSLHVRHLYLLRQTLHSSTVCSNFRPNQEDRSHVLGSTLSHMDQSSLLYCYASG